MIRDGGPAQSPTARVGCRGHSRSRSRSRCRSHPLGVYKDSSLSWPPFPGGRGAGSRAAHPGHRERGAARAWWHRPPSARPAGPATSAGPSGARGHGPLPPGGARPAPPSWRGGVPVRTRAPSRFPLPRRPPPSELRLAIGGRGGSGRLHAARAGSGGSRDRKRRWERCGGP